MSQTTPFSATELTQIRYYAGYPAFGGFGYLLSPGSATMNTQLANMSDSEQVIIRTSFLAKLPTLEIALTTMGTTLDTAQAGPWVRNVNEFKERSKLFNDFRLAMCRFIGCVPGPALSGGGQVVPC